MKAFEVFVNGHFVCRAGLNDGVLTAIVHWIGGADAPEDTFLSVGGLDSQANQYVDWSVPTIGVGTEITVRIVDAEQVDTPAKRKPAKPPSGDTEKPRDGLPSPRRGATT